MDIHISLQPEIIGHIAGFPISNSLLLTFIVSLLLLGGVFFATRSMSLVPSKLQNAIESIIETMLDFMATVLGNKKEAKQFFPLVASFFLVILLNNWIGLFPGVGSITIKEGAEGTGIEEVQAPLFRAANSDLNTTFALALVSILAVQLYGMRSVGVGRHLGKYFMLKKGPIFLFVGLLELVGELARVMSFAFRLFGNIFAGEVLLVTIMALIPFIAPLPFFLLEIFVGFIQALVFSMLTLVFLKIATEKAGH